MANVSYLFQDHSIFHGSKKRRKSQRSKQRYSHDNAFATIGRKHFMVEDWNDQGALLNGEAGQFEPGEKIEFNMFFKIDGTLLSISRAATVVRVNSGKRLALFFGKTSVQEKNIFGRIVDNLLCKQMLQSQDAINV